MNVKKFFGVFLLALSGGVAGLDREASGQATQFLRGDADGSGLMDITDAIFILQNLFLGGQGPSCQPIADADSSGVVDITDAISILQVLFLGLGKIEPLTPEELLNCRGFDPEQVKRGAKVFETADSQGNFFSCSTCHHMIPDQDSTILLPGHSLYDALKRPNFKSGQRANFLGAANVCRLDWMLVPTPQAWNENSQDFKDLLVFMESTHQGPQSVPALQYEIVKPAKTGPSSGNAQAGCELFNRSCSVCHAKNGIGSDLAPSLVDIPPPPNNIDTKFLDNPDYLRTKIRLSGPPTSVYGTDLVGLVMPFWSKDKLTDGQVEDLVAYILTTRELIRQGSPAMECSEVIDPNAKALRRGELVNRGTYGVSGTAEELDTHQIRLSNFSYSGRGILVQVWLFKQGSIASGKAIGPDLRRQPGYTNETLIMDIPPEITSDQFDSVSIWCVSARANFGDAKLETVP